MITDARVKVDQIAPDVLAESAMEYPRMTKLGQIFTADWKVRLALAGKMYKVHIGAIAAGVDVTQVVGGGAGTIPDIERPEIVVGVDAGYFLIPIECDATLYSATIAPDEYLSAMLLLDRSNAPPATVTGTVVTPINMLDGAAAFPGRAFKEITGDMLDPELDDLLMYRRREVTAVNMAGTSANEDDAIIPNLQFHWKAKFPIFVAGPCSMTFWYAGTLAVTGLACMTFAAIPDSWVPTS